MATMNMNMSSMDMTAQSSGTGSTASGTAAPTVAFASPTATATGSSSPSASGSTTYSSPSYSGSYTLPLMFSGSSGSTSGSGSSTTSGSTSGSTASPFYTFTSSTSPIYTLTGGTPSGSGSAPLPALSPTSITALLPSGSGTAPSGSGSTPSLPALSPTSITALLPSGSGTAPSGSGTTPSLPALSPTSITALLPSGSGTSYYDDPAHQPLPNGPSPYSTAPVPNTYYNGIDTINRGLDSVPGASFGDPTPSILGSINQAPSPLKEIGSAFATPILTLGHSGSVFTPVNTVQNIYDLWFNPTQPPSAGASILNPGSDLATNIENQVGLGVISGIGDSTKAGLASANFATQVGNLFVQAACPALDVIAPTPANYVTNLAMSPVVAESGQLVKSGIDLNQGVLKNYANAKESVLIVPRTIEQTNIPVVGNAGAVAMTAASYVLTEPQFVVEHYSMEINKTTNLVNAGVVGTAHLANDLTSGQCANVVPDLMITAHSLTDTINSFDVHHMFHDMPFTTGIVPTAAALADNAGQLTGTPDVAIVPREVSNKTVDLVNNLHFSVLQPALLLDGNMVSGMTGGQSWPITNVPPTTLIPDGNYERGTTGAPSAMPAGPASTLNNLFGQVSSVAVYHPAPTNSAYPMMPMTASAPNYYSMDMNSPGYYN